MKIIINTYKKHNGEQMIYINNSQKASIGISANDYASHSKQTGGQKNMIQALNDYMADVAPRFAGDIAKHTEGNYNAPLKLANDAILVGTDVGQIGGMKVDGDGGYLIKNGGIVKCGVWFETEVEGE